MHLIFVLFRHALRRLLPLTLSGAVSLMFGCGAAWSIEPAKEVVLIGGPKSHCPGEHDFPKGIAVLQRLLEASPEARGVKIVSYPDGWPAGAGLAEASTVVFYFDGLNAHPLLNTEHRAEFEKLMSLGAGVVALHQAATVPANDTTLQLQASLGAARFGMFDRTTETVLFKPSPHPISNGLKEFQLTDEFFPTATFPDSAKSTPILVGKLHPQYRNGQYLVIDKAETHPVAWAFERANGGRAFTFTGLHYLVGLDDPSLRKLLLNAILWTAKINIPPEGATTGAPADAARQALAQETAATKTPAPAIAKGIVRKSAHNEVIDYPWGRLTWYVSRELGNSDTMTTGEAVIRPGRENPAHFHPNCDEVLHVLKGRILNTVGNESVEMTAGDTVTIPAGIHHKARNIGTEDAVLALSYSSADRQVVGE